MRKNDASFTKIENGFKFFLKASMLKLKMGLSSSFHISFTTRQKREFWFTPIFTLFTVATFVEDKPRSTCNTVTGESNAQNVFFF